MMKFIRSQAAAATIEPARSPLAPSPVGNAVVARDVFRRFGEGDSAVEAIRAASSPR
jgi:hypothetical protein